MNHSSTSRHSRKSRNKEGRKKYRLRKGSKHEDFALKEALAEIVTTADKMKGKNNGSEHLKQIEVEEVWRWRGGMQKMSPRVQVYMRKGEGEGEKFLKLEILKRNEVPRYVGVNSIVCYARCT